MEVRLPLDGEPLSQGLTEDFEWYEHDMTSIVHIVVPVQNIELVDDQNND